MIWTLIAAAWAGELALQIDTRELVVGQAVPVKLAVINGKAQSKPSLPVGDGLLAQYQGQSSQHMMVNFETTRITEYNYQLAATKAGTWSVGPVELVVDGERLTAGPVQIEVCEPPVSQGSAPVVATISDPDPVLGQVVVYRFQFQYDRPLVNARWNRPEFPGFVEEVHAEADSMFDVVDLDADGEITTAELRTHVLSHDYSAEGADAVFRSLDEDGNGSLDREELRSGFLKYSMLRQAIIAVVTTLVKTKRWSPAQK